MLSSTIALSQGQWCCFAQAPSEVTFRSGRNRDFSIAHRHSAHRRSARQSADLHAPLRNDHRREHAYIGRRHITDPLAR